MAALYHSEDYVIIPRSTRASVPAEILNAEGPRRGQVCTANSIGHIQCKGARKPRTYNIAHADSSQPVYRIPSPVGEGQTVKTRIQDHQGEVKDLRRASASQSVSMRSKYHMD